MHKIWSFGWFWSIETLFEKIYFLKYIKGALSTSVHYRIMLLQIWSEPIHCGDATSCNGVTLSSCHDAVWACCIEGSPKYGHKWKLLAIFGRWYFHEKMYNLMKKSKMLKLYFEPLFCCLPERSLYLHGYKHCKYI